MKSLLCLLYVAFCIHLAQAQEKILVLGNAESICWPDSLRVTTNLPKEAGLLNFDVVFVFSSAVTDLDSSFIRSLDSAVYYDGLSLYIGAENWPMQADANALTEQMFQQSFYSVAQKHEDVIDASTSVVYFPLSFSFQPLLWDQDEPVLQLGNYGRGKVMVDGAYSRLYCTNGKINAQELFLDLLVKLKNN